MVVFWSPTVMMALRALRPVFATSDITTVVVPTPFVLDSVRKPALDDACHPQLFGITVILRVAVCAAAVSARNTGASWTLQFDESDDDGSVEDAAHRDASTAQTTARPRATFATHPHIAAAGDSLFRL